MNLESIESTRLIRVQIRMKTLRADVMLQIWRQRLKLEKDSGGVALK